MAEYSYDYIEGLASAEDRSGLLSARGIHSAAVMAARDPDRFEQFMARLEGWSARGDFLDGLKAHLREVKRTKTRQRRDLRVSGEDGLERDGNGVVLVTAENVRAAINALGVNLTFDLFRSVPLVKGLAGFGPALDDHAMRRIWLMLETRFDFRPPRQLFDEVALDLAYQHRSHPVRAYLDYEIFWDGTPRLDTWLIDFAGAPDSAYVRAVGAKVLIAAVRRVRSPGAKFDEMLVIESAEQGLGKSSLVQALAVKPEWFTDSVPLNADDKRMMEAMAGKWIAEVAELQGMRKGEVERIRSQLSRQSDRARPAYGRLTEERPRSFVLIGTTNATADYLADINGNRRFWPVNVGRCDVAGFIRVRDQIWAEAVAREEAGESIRLPEELWAAAGREQEARAIGNAFSDKLAPILGGWSGVLRANDAWTLVGVPVLQRRVNAQDFGNAMKALGWTRKPRRLKRGHDPEPCYVKGPSPRVIEIAREHVGTDYSLAYARRIEATTADDDY